MILTTFFGLKYCLVLAVVRMQPCPAFFPNSLVLYKDRAEKEALPKVKITFSRVLTYLSSPHKICEKALKTIPEKKDYFSSCLQFRDLFSIKCISLNCLIKKKSIYSFL